MRLRRLLQDLTTLVSVAEGRRASPIGTKSVHGGKPVIRTAKGWEPDTSGSSDKPKHSEPPAHTTPGKPEAERPSEPPPYADVGISAKKGDSLTHDELAYLAMSKPSAKTGKAKKHSDKHVRQTLGKSQEELLKMGWSIRAKLGLTTMDRLSAGYNKVFGAKA